MQKVLQDLLQYAILHTHTHTHSYTHTHTHTHIHTRLQINAYGNDKGFGGTHVSVFAYLMSGEHDQHLQWPFTGEFFIELLNWREDKGHQGWLNCFRLWLCLSHFYLPYDSITNTEYLRDDCLQLIVSITIINCWPREHVQYTDNIVWLTAPLCKLRLQLKPS